MTESEAKEVLQLNMPLVASKEANKAMEIAINALEKQIPKKPIVDTGKFYFYKPIPIYRCPMCNNSTLERNQGHCDCGQKLDWSEV